MSKNNKVVELKLKSALVSVTKCNKAKTKSKEKN